MSILNSILKVADKAHKILSVVDLGKSVFSSKSSSSKSNFDKLVAYDPMNKPTYSNIVIMSSSSKELYELINKISTFNYSAISEVIRLENGDFAQVVKRR